MAEHRLLDAATAEFGEGRAAAEFGQISVDHEPCNARDRAIDAGAMQANARPGEERGEPHLRRLKGGTLPGMGLDCLLWSGREESGLG